MIPEPITRRALPPISPIVQSEMAELIASSPAQFQSWYENQWLLETAENNWFFVFITKIKHRFLVEQDAWQWAFAPVTEAIKRECARFDLAMPYIPLGTIESFRYGELRERYGFSDCIETLCDRVENVQDGWCYFVSRLPSLERQGIIYATVVTWILLDAAAPFDLSRIVLLV